MSLASDLQKPPRGPAKWSWVSEMLGAIARQAGLISPDATVEIKRNVSGGFTVRAVRRTTSSSGSWQLVYDGGNITVEGGDVTINGVDTHAISDATLSVVAGTRIVCVKIELELTPTGSALRARWFEELNDYTVTASEIVSITTSTLEAARCVLPGTRDTGVIYIPLGIVENGTIDQVVLLTGPFLVTLRHGDFTVFAS